MFRSSVSPTNAESQSIPWVRHTATPAASATRSYAVQWIGCRQNIDRKPWLLPSNIGVSCKIPFIPSTNSERHMINICFCSVWIPHCHVDTCHSWVCFYSSPCKAPGNWSLVVANNHKLPTGSCEYFGESTYVYPWIYLVDVWFWRYWYTDTDRY